MLRASKCALSLIQGKIRLLLLLPQAHYNRANVCHVHRACALCEFIWAAAKDTEGVCRLMSLLEATTLAVFVRFYKHITSPASR